MKRSFMRLLSVPLPEPDDPEGADDISKLDESGEVDEVRFKAGRSSSYAAPLCVCKSSPLSSYLISSGLGVYTNRLVVPICAGRGRRTHGS